MQIISWNIQAAKGVDGVVDVERIAATVRALGDADVLCFQEVLCDPAASDPAERDQAEALAARFPDHAPFFGAAVDRLAGTGRLRFGNLALSRRPVLECVVHKLPQPADAAARHMPRQAVELVIDDPGGPIRVVSTHLEYFSAVQRSAQVRYLRDHHRECLARAAEPSPGGGRGQFAALPETGRNVYCGDFNLTVGSDDYRALVDSDRRADGEADGRAGLVDCWTLTHPHAPHAPTCGVFDRLQWSEGPHCRDYFFASDALAGRVTAMAVDVDTAASDHQPIALTLG